MVEVVEEETELVEQKEKEVVKSEEEVKNREKEINFPPMMCQILARHMGYCTSSYLGNDLYYLNEDVKLMVGYIRALRGEKWFLDNIPDWEVKKKHLLVLNRRLQKVKTWYDVIENKKLDKKDVEVKVKKYFFETARKISLIDQDLYDVYGFLLLNTNLKRQIIPSDAFRIIEQAGYRTLHLEKKKGEAKKTTPTEVSSSETN